MGKFRQVVSMMALSTRSMISYRGDFLIGAIGVLLFHFTNLAALYLVFSIGGSIKGWTPTQAVFLGAVSNLRFALGGLFFWGLNQLPGFIRNGKLDRVLLYPISPVVTLLSTGVDPVGLIDLVCLLGAVLWSASSFAALGLANVLGFLTLLVIGLFATLGFTLLTVSPSFWSPSQNGLPNAFRLMWEFQPYPANLFPGGVRFLITWIFPVAIAVSVPANVLFGQTSFLQGLATAGLVTLVDLVAGFAAFRAGLKRYQSVGH
ncbi:MAG: ABC transporter permease [Bacillota bacterium]